MPIESSIYTPVSGPRRTALYRHKQFRSTDLRPCQKNFEHYHKDNCALISNNIYTILVRRKRMIFSLSTDTRTDGFYPVEKRFHNWTKEQGLHSDHFNANSGTLSKNGNAIFGNTDGAIEFNKDMVLPRDYKFKMIFSDLRIFYQTVYPKDEGSPWFWISTKPKA